MDAVPTQKPQPSFALRLEELFGIDLRSLAVFRICLALLIIADLINRSTYIRAHYTDFGVLPRAALLAEFSPRWHLSVHLLNGSLAVQAALFLVAGILAVALLLGYRTRLVTFLSWFLMISVHARNPVVLQSGDILFRLLLFWSLFLPLGARYSLDSALNNSSQKLPDRILSVGTTALLLQICCVYWFTAALKVHPVWWQEGSAVYYALSLDQFTTPLGRFLLGFPHLLTFLTHATLWIEMFAPTLAFVPIFTSFIRLAVVIVFVLLHLGFAVCMELGLFSYISMVGWLVFIPSELWDRLDHRARIPARTNLTIYYDGDCDFCRKVVLVLKTFLLLPETSILSAQEHPAIQAHMRLHNSWVVVDHEDNRHIKFAAFAYLCRLSPLFWPLSPLVSWRPVVLIGNVLYEKMATNRSRGKALTAFLQYRSVTISSSWLVNAMAAFCLLYIFLWNLRTLDYEKYHKIFPRQINWIGHVLRLDQKWGMFAPYPLKEDGWYVMPGTLRDGTQVDLFTEGGPVYWEKPDLVSATYKNQRWRKYLMNLWQKNHSAHRLHYGRYLCRQWNTWHTRQKRLDTFRIYFMREDTLPHFQVAKPQKILLWRHYCFKKPADW